MGADEVKGKPYQGNADEHRNQKGHHNPPQDGHAKSPSQRRGYSVAVAATEHQQQIDLVRSSAASVFPQLCCEQSVVC